MNDEHSYMAMSSIGDAAEMSKYHIQLATVEYQEHAMELKRPSMMLRPKLYIDGNRWCALYGANLQDGVSGFGDSPALAMTDFDIQWNKPLTQPVKTCKV